MLTLGIDLGTSSVKIIAMNEKNAIVGEAGAEYPIYYPQEGWAEQNPEDWWQGTLEALKKLLALPGIDAKDVKGIGFSGQMHGLVSLDKDNNVLHPALLWCDQRTEAECDAITEAFGLDGLKDTVANQALTGFTAPKLLWIKRHHPELYAQIKHVLLPKDYIRFKLSGDYATDYSDASGMLLVDIRNKVWSKEMCDFLELDMAVLPKLYHSYEVTGKVSSDICETLGFQEDVLIVGGAGDQAAGAVGTGTVKPGVVSVTLGTSGVVFAAHDAFAVDDSMRLHAFCHANGKYHSMGVMLSAANSLKWWSESMHPETPLETLLLEAEAAPIGSQNVVFLPYLQGERTPYADPKARGTFVGMTSATTRGSMTRAILEGVTFGLNDSLEILKANNVPITEIRMIGGGAKSAFWQQILADVFNAPVCKVNTDQGGALGAAILASVGCGLYPTVEAACEAIITTSNTVLPRAEFATKYHAIHERYTALYFALKEWF